MSSIPTRRGRCQVRPGDRLGLVPLVRETDLLAAQGAVPPGRQLRRGDHAADGDHSRADVPDRAEGLRQHGADARGAAQDEGAAGTLQGRQGPAAAGNVRSSTRKRRSTRWRAACRCSCRSRSSSRCTRCCCCRSRCATSRSCCGSRICRRPIRLHVLNLFGLLDFTLPSFLAHRPAGAAAGHHDVPHLPPQPGGDGPDAAADLLDHAVGDDVRHGAVRGRPAALLDHLQPADRWRSSSISIRSTRSSRRRRKGPGGKGPRPERGKLEG